MKSKKLWRKLWVLPVLVFALVAGLFLFTGSVSAADLTFGSPASFTGQIANFYEHSVCTLDSSHVAVVYRDASDTYGKVRIGEKSGTNISWGTASTFNSESTDELDIECLSDSKIIVSFQDANSGSTKGNAMIGNVSTASDTVTSWGSEYEIKSDSTFFTSIAKLSSGRVAISYSYGSISQTGAVIIGEISGTVITFGSEVIFNGGSGTEYSNTVALSDTVFVVAFSNKNDSGTGYAIVGSVPAVSGTTITYGSMQKFDSGSNNDGEISIDRLSASSFVIGFHDDNDNGHVIAGATDGTNISFPGNSTQIAESTGSESIVAIDSKHIIAFYRDINNSSYGAARMGTLSGAEFTFRPSYVFAATNMRLPEATMLDGTNFVTIYKNNATSTDYGLVGKYNAPTFNLHGIGSIIIDSVNNLLLSISVSNHGINAHVEGPNGSFTEHMGIISGGNISLSNTRPVICGVNIICFQYTITASPTQVRTVEYNYATNTVVSDTLRDSDTYFNMSSSLASYNSKPIEFYIEIDGTAHVVVNGVDHAFTLDVAAIDAPVAVQYDSVSDKVHFVYQDSNYNLREGSFDKDGPYSLTTTVVEALSDRTYGVKIPGILGGEAIVGYMRNDYSLRIASNPAASWVVNSLSSSQPSESAPFDVKLDPDNLTTNAMFFYNDGNNLVSNNTVIATGIATPTTIASGTSYDLSPSITGESAAGIEYVFGLEDGGGSGIDTLYSYTEGAGAPIEMDQQGDGDPAIPELPTNVIWKIVIALMAMGAVIGIAAIFRKRGVKEAQDIVAGKKPTLKAKAGRPRKTTKK